MKRLAALVLSAILALALAVPAWAEEAEETAKTRMSEQARARKALPKSQRTDRAVAPAPDYMSMSKEAFRALEQQYRNAAHNGKRVHI